MPDRSRSQLVSTPCASGSRSHGADVAPLPCANGYPLAEGSCRTGTADRQGWLTGETDHWCKTSASATSAGRLPPSRSEEHTSELQSLMRISYAVFCLKKKKKI